MSGEPMDAETFAEKCADVRAVIQWLARHEGDAPENVQTLLGLREDIADLLGEPGRTEPPREDREEMWEHAL